MSISKKLIAITLLGAALLMVSCNGNTPAENGVSVSPGGMWDVTSSRRESSSDAKDGWIEYQQTPGTPKTGILDFSWLNEAPAGKYGHILERDGYFVYENTGKKVKFFGVVLGFGAATPDKKVAEAMAEELSSSGVNLVRIHAIDCTYSGVVDYTKPKGDQFNVDALDKMDYLIYCLKQKGIYIHLDTNAGRVIKAAEGFTAEEVKAGSSGALRATRFFDERIIEIEQNFTLSLLEHVNPYTGMSYAKDPVIAMLQYTNESSITWYDSYNPDTVFTRALNVRYNQWLVKKYKTRSALDRAWTDLSGNKALKPGEDPLQGTVASSVIGSWGEALVNYQTSYDQVTCSPRHADFMSFLMEIQTETFSAIYQKVRALGFKSGISCSNQPERAVDIKLNAQGDIMEKNAYWNHPIGNYSVPTKFHKYEMASIDPRGTYGGNWFATHSVGIVSRGSVADKPLVVTEWNATTPTAFKADTILQMAAYGALQDWDGFCLFIYTFEGSESGFFGTKGYTSFFNANIDPSIWGQFGIASAIFRLGLVKPAKNSVEVVFTDEDVLAQNADFWKITQVIPFVSRFSYRFIDDKYTGNADLVIPSGNTSSGDYTGAKHLLMLSENPYSDPYNKVLGRDAWIAKHTEKNTDEMKIGQLTFKFGKKRAVAVNPSDSGKFYSNAEFDEVLTKIMREFGMIGDAHGWSEDKVISDTGEIRYNIADGNFQVHTDRVGIFAGKAGRRADVFTSGVCRFETDNTRAAVAVMSMENKPIADASKILVYAMGRCTNTGMEWDINDDEILTNLGIDPIIYEDIRGKLFIPSNFSECSVWGLDAVGKRIKEIPAAAVNNGFEFSLGGYVTYEVILK